MHLSWGLSLSLSAGSAAKPVLWEFLRQYPSPELAVQADPRDLASMLNPLGLHEKRAQIIIKFTGQWAIITGAMEFGATNEHALSIAMHMPNMIIVSCDIVSMIVWL